MTTEQEGKKKHIFCPYCDQEVAEGNFPYCRACRVTIFYCPKCRKPVPRESKTCPHCGAKIKG